MFANALAASHAFGSLKNGFEWRHDDLSVLDGNNRADRLSQERKCDHRR